jgi:tRNA pseudouridine32 synthase/23S rRNA pseudouridine746 synthase
MLGAMQVLFVDSDLIVVDKPAGLLAVPGRGDAGHDCLAVRVQASWPDALVVHRLDMATSGLMLLARGKPMQSALSGAFADRRVAKRYVAVVHGLVARDAGCIEAPLAADWPNRPRQQVDFVHGRAATTLWRVLHRDVPAGTTRLELEPVTGRSHQLRVHLLSIGHPICGDALYASAAGDSARLLLHATRLELRHPRSGLPLRFDSPPPF